MDKSDSRTGFQLTPAVKCMANTHCILSEEIIHLGLESSSFVRWTHTGHGLRASCEQGSRGVKIKTQQLLAPGGGWGLPVQRPGDKFGWEQRHPQEGAQTAQYRVIFAFFSTLYF